MHISRWGNSLAVRIPAALAKAHDLKDGDPVELNVTAPGRLTITRDDRSAKALEIMRSLAKPLPAGWRFDRDEANER